MHRVGSTPTPGTNVFSELTSDLGVTLIERSGLKVAIRVAAGVPQFHLCAQPGQPHQQYDQRAY